MELCTESSHINPLLGPGLLLSLPPMSFSLFCLCLCHPVHCSCCLSLLFPYLHISLPLSLCLSPFNLFPPIYPITLHYRYPTASLYWHCKSLIHVQLLPHCPESIPPTSTGGKCHSGRKMCGNNRKGMEVRLQGWVILCVCVTGETEGWGK